MISLSVSPGSAGLVAKNSRQEIQLCVDLCSGWGAFSQPFLDAGWSVIRIDNNPKFADVPHTYLVDILNQAEVLRWIAGRHVDLVVAGPPCERFSIANRMFPKLGIRKALEIVGAVYEIIAELRPDFWIVENPKGRLRWFLGKPNSSVSLSNFGGKYKKPTDLWHNFALPMIAGERPFQPSWSSVKNQGKGSTGLLRLRDPSLRAKLPYGLGLAVLKAIEPQLLEKSEEPTTT